MPHHPMKTFDDDVSACLSSATSSASDKVMSQSGPLGTSMLPLVITRKGAMENCVFDLINFDCTSGNLFLEVEKKLKELYA
jgi:hypothetical protein